MTIRISNVRRPGSIYDSAKLAQLGGMIASSVNQKFDGGYKSESIVKGRTIWISLKTRYFKKIRGKEIILYKGASKSDQSILAGKIATFLGSQGIVSDVRAV